MTINGRESQQKVIPPALARRTYQITSRSLSTLDHVQGRRHFAASIRHHPHIACKQLHECLEIARLNGRHERGHELRMLRVDPPEGCGGRVAPRGRTALRWARARAA